MFKNKELLAEIKKNIKWEYRRFNALGRRYHGYHHNESRGSIDEYICKYRGDEWLIRKTDKPINFTKKDNAKYKIAEVASRKDIFYIPNPAENTLNYKSSILKISTASDFYANFGHSGDAVNYLAITI